MTPAESARLLAQLRAAYPRQEVPAPTLKLYAEMLADLSAGEAERAMREHIAESQYFPTIAEIRQRAARREVGVEAAELQWGNVLSLVSRFGRYRLAEAEQVMDPVTRRAVQAIGWESICNTEMPGVERAAFVRAFGAAQKAAERDANVGRLEAAREGRTRPALDSGPPLRALREAPANPFDSVPATEVKDLLERVSAKWREPGDDDEPEAA